MRRILDGLYLVCGYLAGLFLALIAVMILAQIGGRFFGVVIPAADEFAGFSMAASSFLALAYTLRAGAHIRVTLILQRLPWGVRRVIEFAVLCLATGFVGYFAWQSAVMTWESRVFGDVAQGLVATPLWIPQLGMTIGLAVLAVALADDLVRLIGGREPSYVAAEAADLTTGADR